MFIQRLKNLVLPDRLSSVPILLGPFRGAKLHTRLRDNLRKVFGLYEREINDWLVAVLPRVERVIDVGANDGYFSLGCAAAMRRLKRPVEVFAFEPQATCCEALRESTRRESLDHGSVTIVVEQTLVGRIDDADQISLDTAARRSSSLMDCHRALIKIDVEGAEVDVIEGASLWLNNTNYFVIEVHHEAYLDVLKKRFAEVGLSLEQRDMKPLPILGAEWRSEKTWFLVSALS